jgi:hypothetical protein
MTLRPGWLADDEAWRDQLAAMTPADVAELEASWRAAGGRAPAVDTSWVRLEGGEPWPLWAVLLAIVTLTLAVFSPAIVALAML